MFKNFIALIIASLVVVFSMRFIQVVLNGLLQLQAKLNHLLHTLLTGPVGDVVAAVLAMMILPIIVGVIVGLVIGLISKRREQACFFAIVVTWVIWPMLVVAVAIR